MSWPMAQVSQRELIEIRGAHWGMTSAINYTEVSLVTGTQYYKVRVYGLIVYFSSEGKVLE